jgi:two-component system, NtrC family, sensor kinase
MTRISVPVNKSIHHPLRSSTDVRGRLGIIESEPSVQLAHAEQLERDLGLRNAALDVASSYFVIADVRHRERPMVYVNRAYASAHGYEAQELIGRSMSVLLVPEAFTVEMLAQMDAILAAGGQYRAEVQGLRRDGTRFWIGFTTMALRNAQGEISHHVSVGADITARLEAERRRQELQAQLDSEMRERERMAIELRLAQKLESVGRLAAGLAHEINTPIQYVSDSAYFLRSSFEDTLRLLNAHREALGALSGEQAQSARAHISALEGELDYSFLQQEVPRAFERTLEGTHRVADLVRAMKEFAHPDATEHSPAELNDAIETTLIVCRNEYKYVAQVATHFATLPSVVCNVGELNQVILNLIVNAAHAVQDCGKDLEQGRITISTHADDDSVRITVSDNGCGIRSENIDKIFDPFYTTKEIGRGTGQGLAIARTIVVDKHGGDLQVVSEPGVGTTFTIVLPTNGTVKAVA